MDIFIHSLSGAIVAASGTSLITNIKHYQKWSITLVGLILGAFPDIDALSLAPGFDQTIGQWFSLPKGKVIYSAKFWYSHHAFFHSLVAAALVSGATYWLWQRPSRNKHQLRIWAIFFLAYCAHLMGDLPTPAGSWGGIQLFYPFDTYIGGWGRTWWWNNYDVFVLLVVGLCTILITHVFNLKNYLKWLPSGITFVTVILITCTLITKPIDFSYTGHLPTDKYQDFEMQSKRLQRHRLGETIYGWIEKLDNWIPLYF